MSNVKQNEIDVTFSSTNTMKSVAARYQWDKGIVLNISGIESNKTIMAHCSFEGQLSPAVVVVTSMENGVCTLVIPDELFMQTKAIRCYLYAESSDTGVTVYEIRIPIIARPKPSDYIYDPMEVVPNIAALLAEIENMKAATEEANEAAASVEGFKAEINDQVSQLSEEIGAEIDLSSVTWEEGKSISPTGTVMTQNGDYASDFISVHSPSAIAFEGVDLRGYRTICGYNEDKAFVGLLAGNSTETYPTVSSTVTVDISPEIKYVRVTRHNTVESVPARYVSLNASMYKAVDNVYEAIDVAKDAVRGETITNSGVTITAANKAQYFTDCNDAPLNTVYRIYADAKMENTPLGYGMSTAAGVYDGTLRSVAGYISGTLMTYGVSNSAKHQTFITNAAAGSEPAIMYFRTYYYSTGWTEWHGVSDILSPTSTNIAIRKKMIAPYLDADGNPTATDTGTPNPQYMGDDPRIFNDFNDAPNNSIYQIDLDCDASVMANNPVPGRSSVLVTSGFTYRTRHAIYQMCVGLDEAYKLQVSYRYCYQTATNPVAYTWTDWQRTATKDDLADCLRNKGRIADGSDMNAIRDNSIYLVGDNAGNQNVPSQKAAFLTVKTVNTITLQTYETLDGERYSRNAVGDVWSEWVFN